MTPSYCVSYSINLCRLRKQTLPEEVSILGGVTLKVPLPSVTHAIADCLEKEGLTLPDGPLTTMYRAEIKKNVYYSIQYERVKKISTSQSVQSNVTVDGNLIIYLFEPNSRNRHFSIILLASTGQTKLVTETGIMCDIRSRQLVEMLKRTLHVMGNG